MAKSIIKEIIIMLLICLAIILVLGILLYEYVPASKTMPNEVSYTTPSDVKEELLSSADVDDSQIIVTYEVNQDDLNNYKKCKTINLEKQIHLLQEKQQIALMQQIQQMEIQAQEIQIMEIQEVLQLEIQAQEVKQEEVQILIVIQQLQVEAISQIREQNKISY